MGQPKLGMVWIYGLGAWYETGDRKIDKDEPTIDAADSFSSLTCTYTWIFRSYIGLYSCLYGITKLVWVYFNRMSLLKCEKSHDRSGKMLNPERWLRFRVWVRIRYNHCMTSVSIIARGYSNPHRSLVPKACVPPGNEISPIVV